MIFFLGEIYELKAELNSDKRERKKEAVKKVSLWIFRKIEILSLGYCKYDRGKRC